MAAPAPLAAFNGHHAALFGVGLGAKPSEPPEPVLFEPTTYLKGKTDVFLRRMDVELVCDGVVFPVHSSIVSNVAGLMDQLLEHYLPAGEGEQEGADAGAATGITGRPRIVLSEEGPKGEGAPQAVVTPHKLRLFLEHCYDGDRRITQEQDAISLLQMSDFMQAPTLKAACDRALEAIAKADQVMWEEYKQRNPLGSCGYSPPRRFLELAAQHKLRRLMAYCVSSLLVWMSKGKFGPSRVSLSEAQPYLDLLDGGLKNEVIFELTQNVSLGDGSVAQLSEHFASTLDRLKWDS